MKVLRGILAWPFLVLGLTATLVGVLCGGAVAWVLRDG